MKTIEKVATGGGLAFILFSACAPFLPGPTLDGLSRIQADQPGLTLSDLQTGRHLYAAHCASCHQLHLPSEKTPQAWEKIVPRMGEKGKIDQATCDSILAYLKAMGKKDSP